MNHKFNLFGERPFAAYAQERFASIAKAINKMSDVEILMYDKNFDELIHRLVFDFYLAPIDISFDDKLVDLTGKPYREHTRYYAEYTLMIKGDPNLLLLDPFSAGAAKMTLPVEVKTNVLIFEIDTNYYSDDLTATVMQTVKFEYEKIKNFICFTLLHLNNESQKFNFQLENFIIPILTNKLKKAHHNTHIRQKLNFK